MHAGRGPRGPPPPPPTPGRGLQDNTPAPYAFLPLSRTLTYTRSSTSMYKTNPNFRGTDKDSTLKAEQHHLDMFKPKYNLLKQAGRPVGYKHTEESKAKMRARHLERVWGDNVKITDTSTGDSFMQVTLRHFRCISERGARRWATCVARPSSPSQSVS